MFGNLKHTDRQKAWQKTGWTTLRRQGCFRFTRGASHHHSVNLNILNAKWRHGPPKNHLLPTGWEPLD